MSNTRLFDVKNGGCERDSRFELESSPVSIGSRNEAPDRGTLLRSTEVSVENDTSSERQDGARWNERKETHNAKVDTTNTEKVMVEGEMSRTHNVVLSGFVQSGAMNASGSSSEWVMSAGELGQVLLEIPNDWVDDFHIECTQLNAKQMKAEVGDVENSTLSGNNLLGVCSPRPPKQSVMYVGPESLSTADLTSFDCSNDKSTTRNYDTQFKRDDPNLFHIIEIVPKQEPLVIEESKKNILEQITVPQTSVLQTLPLLKKEVYDSKVNVQTVALEKLLPVANASASNQEDCFSVTSFKNVIVTNPSEINSNLYQIIEVPSVNCNNDVLLNEEAILSSSQCALGSNTVMDLVLETSVFIKDGYESEVKKQILTCGTGNALVSNFKDCFNSDCVNILTPSPDVVFNEFDQSGVQNLIPVDVLSVVRIGKFSAEDVNAAVPTVANDSVRMHSKQLNIDQKVQRLSKLPATVLGQSATDLATKKKVFVLKGAAVNQQSADVGCHKGEEVDCNQTESMKFGCSQEDCDWSFPTAYKLRRHEETHEGRKDFVCSIDGCKKRFTTIYNLKTHLRLHKLPCTEVCPQPTCTQTFRNKRLLDKHMKLHSNGEKTYKCPHPGCTKTFFSQTSIGSHARVHQHDTELICAFDGCGRKFDKLCRLKQHMRCHTGERPYRCTVEGCNWAFSTSSRLCRHLQMHNGQKKWNCPFDGCSKLFTRAEHVRGHLVTHSNQRPFLCLTKGCDARFKSKNSLDIHLKRHSQMDKKSKGVLFYCPHEDCSDRFSTKAQLRAHMDNCEDLSADHKHLQPPGSARTDFTNYHLVNQRTMLKWQDQHPDSIDTAMLNIGQLKDMASLSSEPLHCLPEQMTPGVMLNADEIMTSHAITFRDPETGTIYVQTQLMQDDPPSTNMYLDDGSSSLHLESSEHHHQAPVLAADLTSILHNDNDFSDEDSDDVAYMGTTINLQDLE